MSDYITEPKGPFDPKDAAGKPAPAPPANDAPCKVCLQHGRANCEAHRSSEASNQRSPRAGNSEAEASDARAGSEVEAPTAKGVATQTSNPLPPAVELAHQLIGIVTDAVTVEGCPSDNHTIELYKADEVEQQVVKALESYALSAQQQDCYRCDGPIERGKEIAFHPKCLADYTGSQFLLLQTEAEQSAWAQAILRAAQRVDAALADHNKTHHDEKLEGWLSGISIGIRSLQLAPNWLEQHEQRVIAKAREQGQDDVLNEVSEELATDLRELLVRHGTRQAQ
jgi:hypothetical protein